MKSKDIVLNGGMRLLAKQEQLLMSKALVSAHLGAWGSGKTTSGCLAFLANCIHPGNGWRPEYGSDRPFSLMVAPTHKVLKDSTYRVFMSICPPELILQERKSPDWELLLANGHIIKMRTIRGSLEGASATGILLDECHLIKNEEVFLNYQSRAREPRAARRRVIAVGLPEAGWMQSIFQNNDGDPNRLTILSSAYENTYLPAEVLEQFRRSAPGKTAKKYLEGEWMQKEDRIYYEFNPGKHIVDRKIDRSLPVQIGLDVGDKSHVIMAQIVKVTCKNELGRTYTDKGLLIVDEFPVEKRSTEQVCRLIRDRGWLINQESAIYSDPTLRRDEIASIRMVFPNLSLIKSSRKGNSDNVEHGHHCVNCAFSDADGNSRLFIHADIDRGHGSLYQCILAFVRDKFHRAIRNNFVRPLY